MFVIEILLFLLGGYMFISGRFLRIPVVCGPVVNKPRIARMVGVVAMSPIVFVALPMFIYALGFSTGHPNSQIVEDLYADKFYSFMINLEIFAFTASAVIFAACWGYCGAKYGANINSTRDGV